MPIRILVGLMLVLTAFQVVAQPVVIHEQRSLYRNIVVTEFDGRRCMRFDIHRGGMNQSCMSLSDPKALVFDYTRMSFAGLLLNPDPKRILVAGLGGGSIPVILNEMYPDAHIDVLEVDEAVVSVAEAFFGFEENDNMQVHVVDARVFIKRAGIRGDEYDYVVLDAFSGEYIPEHLLTREFLEEVKQLMPPHGVVVANTFAGSALYDHESVTYQAVFGEFYNFRMPGTGNRIIIAQPQDVPPQGDMRAPARELHEALEQYGVPILEYPARLSTRPDWDESVRVLTDQFSPGNLLRRR